MNSELKNILNNHNVETISELWNKHLIGSYVSRHLYIIFGQNDNIFSRVVYVVDGDNLMDKMHTLTRFCNEDYIIHWQQIEECMIHTAISNFAKDFNIIFSEARNYILDKKFIDNVQLLESGYFRLVKVSDNK
jgi:hypothetical protein